MATMTRREREVLALASKAGAVRIEGPKITKGAHVCVALHAANGKVRKFFTSFTPSDGRGTLNFASEMRSFCRQNAA